MKAIRKPLRRSQVTSHQEKALEKLLKHSLGMRGQYKFRSPYRGGRFVSPKIRVGLFPHGKLIAAEPLPPGSLVFLDLPKISYPNIVLRDMKDFVYKLVDVRKGVMPERWSCVCCTESIGHIVPVWCEHCDLPLCSKCGVGGVHEKLDILCTFVKRTGVRGRRFFELGNVYLDVAITRFLMMQSGSEEFRNEVDQIITSDPRLKLIAASAAKGTNGQKFNQKTLPLAYTAAIPIAFAWANGPKDAVLKAFALLSTFGTGFHPRPEVGIFHPILSMLTQSCYPNVEVQMNGDDRRIGIWTTQWVAAGEQLGIDFLQHPLLPTVYRQRFHKSRWGDGCACARCCDPTELGTFLGSTMCPKCSKGFLSPQFIRFTPDGVRMWDENDVSCFCMDLTNPRHPCRHMCPISALTEVDEMAWGKMAKIAKNQEMSPEEKRQESKKLKVELMSDFGVHVNHFLLHAIDGYKSSPQAQFVKAFRKEEEVEVSDEGVAGFKEQMEDFQRFLSLVRRITPDWSRHNGYMLLHEAELEKTLGKLEEQNRGGGSGAEWEQNYIRKVMPKFMGAWERILWRRSQDDLPALSALSIEFLIMKKDPAISGLILRELKKRSRNKHAQDVALENGAPGETPTEGSDDEEESETEAEENLELSVGPPSKRGAAAQLLLKSVTAAAMSSSDKVGKSGHMARRVKPNKLKEALLRLEEKERAARVKKPLCLLPLDAGTPLESSPAESPPDGAGTSSETTEATVNPIPVHVTTTRVKGYNVGMRRWSSGGKRRYRHNGVDFPYVGTINSHMIINQLGTPKSHKVIDCATYAQNAEGGGVTAEVEGGGLGQVLQEENRGGSFKNGGRNYSVLKYLCGFPPFFHPRKKCGNPDCPEGSHGSNFGGGPPTFFQNWTPPGFHPNFPQGHPQHPVFFQPFFNLHN